MGEDGGIPSLFKTFSMPAEIALSMYCTYKQVFVGSGACFAQVFFSCNLLLYSKILCSKKRSTKVKVRLP